MMLGEESASATYWKKCGDEALRNGVKHVVMMVSVDQTLKALGILLTLIRAPTGQLLETKSKLPQIQILQRVLSLMYTLRNTSIIS